MQNRTEVLSKLEMVRRVNNMVYGDGIFKEDYAEGWCRAHAEAIRTMLDEIIEIIRDKEDEF